MEKYKNTILSFLVGGVTFLFGNNPSTLKIVYALMVFMVFDCLTGIYKAYKNKTKFDYHIFGSGVMNKIIVLVAVSFGYWLDYFNIFHTQNVSFEIAFSSAFLIQEVISVCGNFKAI